MNSKVKGILFAGLLTVGGFQAMNLFVPSGNAANILPADKITKLTQSLDTLAPTMVKLKTSTSNTDERQQANIALSQIAQHIGFQKTESVLTMLKIIEQAYAFPLPNGERRTLKDMMAAYDQTDSEKRAKIEATLAEVAPLDKEALAFSSNIQVSQAALQKHQTVLDTHIRSLFPQAYAASLRYAKIMDMDTSSLIASAANKPSLEEMVRDWNLRTSL